MLLQQFSLLLLLLLASCPKDEKFENFLNFLVSCSRRHRRRRCCCCCCAKCQLELKGFLCNALTLQLLSRLAVLHVCVCVCVLGLSVFVCHSVQVSLNEVGFCQFRAHLGKAYPETKCILWRLCVSFLSLLYLSLSVSLSLPPSPSRSPSLSL